MLGPSADASDGRWLLHAWIVRTCPAQIVKVEFSLPPSLAYQSNWFLQLVGSLG